MRHLSGGQDTHFVGEKMNDIENAPASSVFVENDISSLLNAVKQRLTDAAFRKFYMEAESVGMTLDAYLRSLFV